MAPTLAEAKREALEKALVKATFALKKDGVEESEVRKLVEHTLNEARRG